MELPVPASEAYLRYIEHHSPCVAPDDAKTKSLVRDLVNKRFNKKLEELRIRRSTRNSTRKSTCTVFTFESEEDFSDEVFSEAAKSVPDDASEIISNSTRSFTICFSEDPVTSLAAGQEIISDNEDDDASEASSVAETTTNFSFCFWDTCECQKSWPRQEDLERKVDRLFQKISSRWKKTVHMKELEKNFYRSDFHSPSSSDAVDDFIDTIQTFYKKNGSFDYLCKMELRDLFINAHLENKLQMPFYKSAGVPTFLIIKKLQISDIKISSTEPLLPPHSRCYTFGILNSDDRISKTELEENDESQDVMFSSEHNFENLPYDFEIRLQFFQLCAEGRSRNKCNLWMACLNQFGGSGKIEEKSICEATISREHLKSGHLSHVQKCDVGRLILTAKVTSTVYSQLRLSEYLYYDSSEKKPIVGWTNKKRWCELEHTYIKMWLSHDMTNELPVNCIDLAKARCVRRALPEENLRSYSMVVELDHDIGVRQYIFAHTQEEGIELWIEIIKIVKAATESFS